MFSAETDCETQAPTSLNNMEKEVTKVPMANAWGDHATTDNASRPASSRDHEIGTTGGSSSRPASRAGSGGGWSQRGDQVS